MHAIQSFAKALYFIWENAPMNEFNNDLLNATGEIPYGLTNDCMFHLVFQNDMVALKGLICSVLHLETEDIQ